MGTARNRGFATPMFETGVLQWEESETGVLQMELLKPGFCKYLFDEHASLDEHDEHASLGVTF